MSPAALRAAYAASLDDHPTTVTILAAHYVALTNERDKATERVNDLLLANNREVEARRRFKAERDEHAETAQRRGVKIIELTENAGAYLCRAEKAEADLATVTADRDEWIAAFRDLHHRFQRIERERDAYKAEARDYHEREIMSARPAPDKVPEAEYVFGPWVEVSERPNLPDDTLLDVCMRCETIGEHEIEVLPLENWGNFGGTNDWCLTHYRRAYRIGEWHDWDGSTSSGPIEGNCIVELKFRDGKPGGTYERESEGVWWKHLGTCNDIITFRPVRAS